MKRRETPEESGNWQGLTLEQLRYRRALSAVKLEAGKERITNFMGDTKEKVEKGGLRGLLFSNKMVGRLKWVDYLILGYQVTRGFSKLRRRFK